MWGEVLGPCGREFVDAEQVLLAESLVELQSLLGGDVDVEFGEVRVELRAALEERRLLVVDEQVPRRTVGQGMNRENSTDDSSTSPSICRMPSIVRSSVRGRSPGAPLCMRRARRSRPR
jgi:hypothetical protein